MARTVFEGKFFKITHTIEKEGPHHTVPEAYYDDTFTVCALLKGSGVCSVEGNRYSLKPGDMMLMGLDEIRSFGFEQEGYHERISLYFSSALLSPLWEYELPLVHPFCGHAPGVGNRYSPRDYDYEKASQILKDICCVMTDSTYNDNVDANTAVREDTGIREAKLHLLFLQLLFVLYEAYERRQLPDSNHNSDSVIRDICKYIRENLSEKLTYEHLQDRFLVSRYQLTEIFRMQCKKNSYTLTPEADEAALKMFTRLYEERDENFGNGRDVRNCFEDMVVRQSNRVAGMENPGKEDLIKVLPEDLVDPDEEQA